ncbi:MAG: hypothetical protein FK730_06045 [Asgard group archaeon]|nr:hypothetical protein [Asgard group archaeon]
MNKKILIPILSIGILAVIAGTTVGLVYAFSPADDSVLEVVNVTTQQNDELVNVVLTCDGDESGHTYRHGLRRNFAYMHKVQFRNSTTEEVLYEENYNWQWRHRMHLGKNYMHQFQISGLENGQMLQLRIVYNNGKVLTHNFVV